MPNDCIGIAAIVSQTGFAAAAYKLALGHNKRLDKVEKKQDDHEKDNTRHVTPATATK